MCLTFSNFDFDLWARLIAGMGVIDGHQVLKADFLSYTPTHIWYDHEYGSGIVFYALLKYFGPMSLVFLHALLYFGIFFVISRTLALRGKTAPYNLLFYILGILALTENFNTPIRCHMFSFFLFTVFIYILEFSRKKNYKILYIVPLLTIIWNNLHGGVVAGLGLIGMYMLGEYLNKKPYKPYLISLIISSAVLIINPWGWEYIKFLLMANSMQRPEVAEWWGSFSKFHMFREMYFKFFLFFTLGTELVYLIKNYTSDWYQKADKVKYIIILSTLYLAVSHVKLLPFYVIAAMIFIYEDFFKLTKNIQLPFITKKVTYFLIFALSLLSVTAKEITLPLNFKAYPVKEVEFIKQNKLEGKLLVNFGLGSYASYKLYPQNLIFMDGRYEEVYDDNMVPLLKKFYLVNDGWDEVLIKYTPDVIIIENFYPVYNVLKSYGDWKEVYQGNLYSVFVPAQRVAKKFIQPSDDINYYKKHLFETSIKF